MSSYQFSYSTILWNSNKSIHILFMVQYINKVHCHEHKIVIWGVIELRRFARKCAVVAPFKHTSKISTIHTARIDAQLYMFSESLFPMNQKNIHKHASCATNSKQIYFRIANIWMVMWLSTKQINSPKALIKLD